MIKVLLEGLAPDLDEASIQTWFFEEGDPVEEGEELLELSTGSGILTILVPSSGILAEVYYDEGETVSKGEALCAIDAEEAKV